MNHNPCPANDDAKGAKAGCHENHRESNGPKGKGGTVVGQHIAANGGNGNDNHHGRAG